MEAPIEQQWRHSMHSFTIELFVHFLLKPHYGPLVVALDEGMLYTPVSFGHERTRSLRRNSAAHGVGVCADTTIQILQQKQNVLAMSIASRTCIS